MTEVEKIYTLEVSCFSDPWSITAVENQLKSENSLWLTECENDIPTGYALGSMVCGEAELYRIAVSKDFAVNFNIGNGNSVSLHKCTVAYK